ncbi:MULTISPECIES: hypothetical protein [unclassified Pedobacter]|uniref:hypothetical protein n=1 Tax=unclassified Pedobacter TaxID=2628915 RepID=UPI0014211F00|nr:MULTISPECIES: hypothetical protein [unclassified Pedobacter]NII81260.1 hypothetical protein [Pedobacter sp. SG908]NMN35266.1 hypothetical protein [Pedobacter sp. SG918]
MKIEEKTRQKIIRNAVLSLFIYVLPIVLMFATFYITGERPWLNQQHKAEKTKSVNPKNSSNNGTSD